MASAIFDDIPIGRKFIAASGVTYKKISKTRAQSVKDADGNSIQNGDTTILFYKTGIELTLE